MLYLCAIIPKHYDLEGPLPINLRYYILCCDYEVVWGESREDHAYRLPPNHTKGRS